MRAFLGREAELGVLEAGLDAAREGRGRLFLLVGEAGIGKTRLADELAARAGPRGFRAVWGRCWEAGGAPAYWPWVQVLRTLLRDAAPAARAALVGSEAAELAPLVPELRAGTAEQAGALSRPPTEARFELFDAVVRLLRRAAEAEPLLLLLEDLHVADRPSLLLLRLLARELQGARLLVVGTYRDAEARLSPEHAESLAQVERDAERLPLRRLTPEEVATLMERAAGVAPHPRVVAAVVRATEGTPLFVTEAVRLVMARGALQDPHLPARLLVPDGPQQTVRGHLDRLPDGARALLQVASVLGREFTATLLQAVSGEPHDVVLEALTGATQAALLTEQDPALGRYSFAHILIRETLYRDLGAARRSRLHAQVATALEQLHGADPGEHLAELAHHFLAAGAAGAPERAVEYAARAGAREMAVLAFEEAAVQFGRALDALPLQSPPDERRRCELFLALGEAQTMAGEGQRGRETYLRAAEVARRLQAPDLLARAALGVGTEILAGVVNQTLVALLQEALAALPQEDSPLRARVMARLGAALQPSFTPEVPTGLAKEAVAMARRVGDRATLAAVIFNARSAYMPADDLQERLALDHESVELATEAGHRAMVLQARVRLACELLELGDVQAALAQMDAYDRLAREFRQSSYRWRGLLFRANVALMSGDFAEAERLRDEAVQVRSPEDRSADQALFFFEGAWARTRLRRGELEAALASCLAKLPPHTHSSVLRHMMRAVLCAPLGRVGETQASIEGLFAEPFLPNAAGAPAFAEACALAGARERCTFMYTYLLPRASHADVWGSFALVCEGAIARPLGMLAAALGDREAAFRHFEEALALNARLGARPWLARTQASYAEALLQAGRAGDRARAVELAEAARATAEALGMELLLARLEALPLAPAPRPVVPAPPPAPALLTPPPALTDVLRREGEYWTLSYGEQVARLVDSKGLQLLAHLLQHPGREFHVLDLVALLEGAGGQGARGRAEAERGGSPDLGDAGPLLDAKAKAAYRRRLEDLQEDLREAEAWGDAERAARAREELEFLSEELARSVGLGGRDRKVASSAERARVNVQRRISDAIRKIAKEVPPLGRHLGDRVKTGTFCVYEP